MMWRGQLPEELVVEILSRLPVQSLLRFRCVSKTWMSLIDSPSFLKLHMLKNSNSRISVFGDFHFGQDDGAELNFSLAEVDLVNCSDRLLFRSVTLPPLSPGPLSLGLAGSCDGLLCVATHNFKEFNLVNPSTREYRPLPRPIGSRPIGTNTRSRRHHHLGSGLGYDCSTDEYKFVLIPGKGNKVKIYGSKSNAWRRKDVCSNKDISLLSSFGIKRKSFISSYGLYAHGALYWWTGGPNIVSIVAFCLVTEKFTVSELHMDLFGNPSFIVLEVLGGQLCLCCGHDPQHKSEEGFVMAIWVMEEYGVWESWSKLVSFDRLVRPLALSNCGSRLLFSVSEIWPCGCTFHWYDLSKKSMECTYFYDHSFYDVCSQSLIRLERKLR